MSRILTLTTDFGTRDAYVAAMKGVVLGIAPEVRLVDISHEITPQDIMEAAFVLKNAIPFYPPSTVHLVVVDPGVGTERRPVALRLNDQYLVGPDNGIFALLLNHVSDDQPVEVVQLDRPEFWRTESPSNTFHGRDIFAPVAAHLVAGCTLAEVGSPLEELRMLRWAIPIADSKGIQGWIIHVDHFGNCITNITQNLYDQYRAGRTHKSYVGTTIIQGAHSTYGNVPTGDPVLLFGSSGYLEVAVNNGNASELLGINKGDPINIVFSV